MSGVRASDEMSLPTGALGDDPMPGAPERWSAEIHALPRWIDEASILSGQIS